MNNFKERSFTKELLDNTGISFQDILVNMLELNTINTLLGGHSITLKGVQTLIKGRNKSTLTVCEIGSGGGDNLFAIAKHFKSDSYTLKLIGIDIKEECTKAALKNYPSLSANWITSDYEIAKLPDKPQIIFSSLFCHHFTNEALVKQLQWMYNNCIEGFFINDLHRHPLAYYSIKWITKAFSTSYLVKNDAPLSVLRGFTKKEWNTLLQQAGITNYSIKWKWAFRHLIVAKK